MGNPTPFSTFLPTIRHTQNVKQAEEGKGERRVTFVDFASLVQDVLVTSLANINNDSSRFAQRNGKFQSVVDHVTSQSVFCDDIRVVEALICFICLLVAKLVS